MATKLYSKPTAWPHKFYPGDPVRTPDGPGVIYQKNGDGWNVTLLADESGKGFVAYHDESEITRRNGPNVGPVAPGSLQNFQPRAKTDRVSVISQDGYYKDGATEDPHPIVYVKETLATKPNLVFRVHTHPQELHLPLKDAVSLARQIVANWGKIADYFSVQCPECALNDAHYRPQCDDFICTSCAWTGQLPACGVCDAPIPAGRVVARCDACLANYRAATGDYKPNPWPVATAARVLVDVKSEYRHQEQQVYLKAGDIVRVDSDEYEYLIVDDPNSDNLVPVPKHKVVGVPNCTNEDIPDDAPDGQAFVGDLLDDGYMLDYLDTPEALDNWESFFGSPLSDAAAILWKDGSAYFVYGDVTTISLAIKH